MNLIMSVHRDYSVMYSSVKRELLFGEKEFAAVNEEKEGEKKGKTEIRDFILNNAILY